MVEKLALPELFFLFPHTRKYKKKKRPNRVAYEHKSYITAPFSYNHPPRVSTGLDVIDGHPPRKRHFKIERRKKKKKNLKTPMNFIILVDLFLLMMGRCMGV